MGDSVQVRVRILTVLGNPVPQSGLQLWFTSPPAPGIGGATWSYRVATINTDTWYTVTVSGAASAAGTWTVYALLDLGGLGTTRSQTLSYSVVAGPAIGFDFNIVLSPASQTVEQGGTATFRILLTYSSPAFSGTPITIQITGLGPGMDWRSTLSGDLVISTSASTPIGTYIIVVVGSARGVIRQTSASLTVGRQAPPPPSFDFSISLSPSTQTVRLGEEASFSVTLNLMAGSAVPVSLTLSGLASGLSYTFSPQSGTPTFSSTLKIDASPDSSTGSSTFTITAFGGGLSRTATGSVVVKEPADFSMSVSPTAASAKQGEKVSFNIAVNPVGGFDKVVTLSVAGLPSGATAIFTVPSGKPAFTSTLTVTLSSSVQEGSYSLSIDAAGDVKIHSTRVTLSIERKPTLLEQLFGPDIAPLIPLMAGVIVLVLLIASVVLIVRRRGAHVAAKTEPLAPAAPPPAATKYCTNCGASIPMTAKHCGKCGASQQ